MAFADTQIILPKNEHIMKYVSNIYDVFCCSLVRNVNLLFHIEDFILLKIWTQENLLIFSNLVTLNVSFCAPSKPHQWGN